MKSDIFPTDESPSRMTLCVASLYRENRFFRSLFIDDVCVSILVSKSPLTISNDFFIAAKSEWLILGF